MYNARQDEILAKKAKLAELKRQRELRATQATTTRQSSGVPGAVASISGDGRADNKREIESLINSLVGESRSVSSSTGGAGSPARRPSRRNSVLSAGDVSHDHNWEAAGGPGAGPAARSPSQPQALSTVSLTTIYECRPSPIKEVYSYSKAVQTTDDGTAPAPRPRVVSESDHEEASTTPSKRLSRRERNKEEELRENIRREIEEELRAAHDVAAGGTLKSRAVANFPARTLTSEELKAVTQCESFMEFIDRSTKVIEKALDQEYDILTDYMVQGQGVDDDDDNDEHGIVGGRGRRKVRELAQFYDERWSKKRIISSIDFSPKFAELLLASYTKNPSAPHEPDGIVQVWNVHLHDRPEFVFTAQSDVLTAKFSPFHVNLIVGSAYSGQVLVWDTRARSAPVQKTPLTGSGHAHPVYAVDIVGTQNANNIISCSTDGQMCGWTVDMFTQPQENLQLLAPAPAKTEVLSPTCMAFPHADPTFFLVGSEEGTIFPCHRYDRAGAKAGVDPRVSYKGHAGPVMSVDYHPARGPVDLGDLVLSASLDWSVKLWKVRAPAATTTADVAGTAGLGEGAVAPLMDFVREDVVYDAAWSPVKPGVFGVVDGAGWLELWDLTVETEEPVARITPSPRKDGRTMLSKSLNKVAWERAEGKRVATGGIDAALTMFEVGPDLGGKEGLKSEEWTSMKKLVNRIEAVGVDGAA